MTLDPCHISLFPQTLLLGSNRLFLARCHIPGGELNLSVCFSFLTTDPLFSLSVKKKYKDRDKPIPHLLLKTFDHFSSPVIIQQSSMFSQ